MRKSLWLIPVALLFTALGSTAALADTVIATGPDVTAIDGIVIAGTTYNLTFTTTALTSYTGAPTGITAVETQLISDLTGYSSVDGEIGLILYNGVSGEDTVGYFGTWGINNGTENFACTPGGASCLAIWANFTPVATPEPSSVLLFGSGLVAFIGLIRRKVRL
ncbi:MAG TPA: PEP-CTERM sorting domain-containing protein [Candidatus Acidoferrales bacterium]|nr:PEP-CTERM sorting domain-containing protein [Candidatus Acidoferrales bacterium]